MIKLFNRMDRKHSKIFYFVIALILLISPIECVDFKVKPTNELRNLKGEPPSNSVSQSIVIQMINILMDNKKIVNNNQYAGCFTNQQMSTLDLRIQQGLDIGRGLTQNTIENYPKLISQYLSQTFTKEEIQCFTNSNDLKMLMLSYHVQSLEQAIQAFQHYSYQHFTDTHEILLTLIQFIKTKDLQQLISYTDKVFNKMFTQFLSDPDLDEWGIQVIDPQINPLPYYGITNSNGLIGAVSDKMPFKISQTVLAGAYDKYGRGRVDNIVQTMNVMDLELTINGIRFPQLDLLNFRQYIDFKKAQFTGTYSIINKASVSYKYMTLKNNPGTFFLQTEVTAHQDININVKNSHTVPDYLNDVEKQYENVPNKQSYRVITTKATTKTNKIDIVLSSTFYVDDDSKKFMTGDSMGHEDWDSNRHLHTLTNIKVTNGSVFKFYLVSALISSQHHKDPKNEAIRLLLKVASTKSQLIKNQHYGLWQDLWKNDIIIDGNSKDQRTIRSMVYHFYSFINEFKSYGLSPMGLSGLGYNGHVFWDMDLWMYPGVLILNPKLAKSLIQYRYDRLDAAKNNAFLNGYKGAMFPWESSKTGDQECPIWAAPGPLEHHITGTVSLAAWKYYCVTKDLEWLKEKGRPIIQGAAQFWQSRVEKDQDGIYHINNVVAADEWAQNIDDDAFTNAIAIESLRIANKMRQVLQIDINPDWDQIRQNIIIHRFNDTKVTKQYATYNGQNIKQADVNLLAFPLKQVVDKVAIRKDLQFYQSRVPVQGTPAMTHAIFALLYSRLGDAKKSYDLFKYSFSNNMLNPFGVMAETQFGTNPYFLTGAGGVIQSVIFGYAGVDITDQGVVRVQTVIPDQWDRVLIKSPVLQASNTLKEFI